MEPPLISSSQSCIIKAHDSLDPKRVLLLQQCKEWEQAIRDAQKALDTARRGKGRADRLLQEHDDERRRERIA